MAGEPSFAADVTITSLHQLPAVTSSMSLSASTTSALLCAVPIFQEGSPLHTSSTSRVPASAGVGDRLAVRWPAGVARSRLCVGVRGNRMEGSSSAGESVVQEEEEEEEGGEVGLRRAQAEMRRMQMSWLDEQVSAVT